MGLVWRTFSGVVTRIMQFVFSLPTLEDKESSKINWRQLEEWVIMMYMMDTNGELNILTLAKA